MTDPTTARPILAVSERDPLRPRLDDDFCRFAVGIGATHTDVSGSPFHYNAFLPDNRDPYPNWSQASMSLFRVCPPAALQPYLPMAVVEENRRVLDERFAALRRHGLRATMSALEPLWLPEAVYQAHPHWRGGQCELGRIANGAYFTPNIDDPEVLELYRQAAAEFVRRYPETDVFSFFTNDSGAGLQWSTYQYPGVNGPTATRQRGPGQRVTDWLNAIRRGAAEAGGDPLLHLHTFTFPPAETEAIRARLGSHLFLKNANGNGEPLWQASAASGGGDQRLILGLPACEPFVEGLQQVFAPGAGPRRSVSVGCPLSRLLVESYLEAPGQGVVNVAQTLRRAAARLAGEAQADALVRVWSKIDRARHSMNQVRQRGGVTPLTGSTMGRWLVRPLVPRPEALTEAETAPFRQFIFSRREDKDIADLCVILGKPVFLGSGAVWMARWALHEAIGTLRDAASQLAAVTAGAAPGQRPWLALTCARVEAFASVLENARTTILYQHALHTADQPRYGANVWDFDDNVMYDQRALELRRLAREELDNTAALLRLLEGAAGPVLVTASEAADESVFVYGPNLAEQLRHKLRVMTAHWHDVEVLFPTSRFHEYEPDLRGRGPVESPGEPLRPG